MPTADAADTKTADTKTADTKTADTKTADTKTADTQTADTKTADTKTADTKTADTKTVETKAPAKYELVLPEGGHVDAKDLTTIEAIARANDWTNEDAQAFVNERAGEIKKAATQFMEETKADPVYGGAQFDQTRKHVDAALDHFRPAGTPRGDAFRALLDKSGYGNHIEVMSLLADLGKAMAEDGNASGLSGGGGETADPATRIYGPGPQVK